MAKRVKAARPRGRNPLDLEAIGLVLLALGVFVLGVLVPALPTGRFGFELRQTLLGRVGWGAYALPVPPLVLGLLFLFRRSPRWWPRALLGYIVLAAGLWGVLMIVAPPLSGRWGVSLRAGLTGAWGTLAVIPAAFVASLGFELLVGLTPTRLTRSLIRAMVQGTRALLAWMLETRRVARDRAAFHADVALARRALGELDRDLQALRTLYPGSAELERWRSEVRATGRRLSKPTAARLRDAQADLKAWQGAVRDFARDRAGEMVSVLKAEVARAPDQEASDLDGWARGLRRVLDDVLAQTSAAAQATDRVRNAMALDLTALIDRYRRLTRERDLDERALKRMTPRQLAQASQDHGKRLEGYRAIENDARTLDAATGALEGFRPLLGVLDRLLSEHPTFPELMEFDASLAAELSEKGRTVFEKVGGWTEALEAVEDRALVAARDAETAQRARQAADAARAAEAVAEEDLDASSERVGSDDGAASLQRELPPLRIGGQGTSGSGGMDAALEAALLDDAVVSLSGRATALVEAAPDAGGSAGSPGSSVPWGQDRSPARAPDDGSDADLSEDAEDADDESGSARAGDVPEYGGIPIQVPPMSLLDVRENGSAEVDRVELEQEHRDRVRKIDETLASFKLDGRVVAAVRGPTVTRFEVEPAPGEKIARFANLSDDLALAMAVGSVRIEAPIPGKSVIGLEVPNATRDLVRFREAAESGSFRRAKARLPIILGKSIDGDMVVGDLVKMPHLLIAGSTGSGKSVAVNTLVGSLLYRFLPTELRLLMIDPKMVELTPYDGVPHLIRPVVTNPTDAAGVLLGAVKHMERRYKMMSKVGAKNLDQYNEKARNLDLPEMPFIALIIDELADLMITTPKEVESAIMRLAQMARATGMHLVLATQRPSVDILTSLIKVNVPARMAFAVSSSHDSRTILDSMGAERLIGMGDMLFYQPGLVKAVRLQGPFISESEIATISDFLRRQYFDDEFVEAFGSDFEPVSSFESDASGLIDWNDDKLRVAAELVINEGQASVSRLQRRLSVGHARAGKLMDSLEALGVVGPHQGSKPRDVLVPYEELPNIFGK